MLINDYIHEKTAHKQLTDAIHMIWFQLFHFPLPSWKFVLKLYQ